MDTAQQQQASTLSRQTNQKTKDMVIASGAYVKNMALQRKGLDAAQKAGDFDTYDSIAGDMQALHYGSVSSGLKLPELKIPDFVPPGAAMDDDLASATEEWERTGKQANSSAGQWESNGKWLNGKTAGQEYMDASQNLSTAQSKYTPRKITPFTPPEDEDTIPLNGSQTGVNPAIEQARQAIAAGADPQAVADLLTSMGIDPNELNK